MKKQSTFLFMNTDLDSRKVLGSVKKTNGIKWADNLFGPYQIAAYLESNYKQGLVDAIEDLRSRRFITNLDARMVKTIPGDEELSDIIINKPESALLLINVDYKVEKERNVTYNLRKIKGVSYARAMWGPDDIIALVESKDHESMRNLICDEVKVSNGVKSNSTLYCYPKLEK